jgi:ABC-2 type transport system permease protein
VFHPLLTTSRGAGINPFEDMVDKHPLFGLQGPMPPRNRTPITNKNHVLAARIKRDAAGDDGPKARNVVVLADLDMFGNMFFQMHERGGDLDADGAVDVRFDNVPFLLNLIDSLAGDDRFIELRKRRPTYRRLSKVDELTAEAREERQEKIEEANAEAEKELEAAQQALDAAVAAVRERSDLDDTTKAIMLKSAEEAENRRLQAKQEKIKIDKDKATAKIQTKHRRAVDEIQNRIRLAAVLVPPIPALLLGVLIFARKRRRERDTIPTSRRVGAAARTATAAAAARGAKAVDDPIPESEDGPPEEAEAADEDEAEHDDAEGDDDEGDKA